MVSRYRHYSDESRRWLDIGWTPQCLSFDPIFFYVTVFGYIFGIVPAFLSAITFRYMTTLNHAVQFVSFACATLSSATVGFVSSWGIMLMYSGGNRASGDYRIAVQLGKLGAISALVCAFI